MINIDNIFKEFGDNNISSPDIETRDIYGWIAPDERSDIANLQKDELKKFSLEPHRSKNPADDGPPQLDAGKTVPRYFYKVYDNTEEIKFFDRAQLPQFTVTYGHADGLGSPPDSNLPTAAIYRQYANSLLPSGEKSFGFDRDHFYAVNLNRRTFQKRIRPGEWQLSLAFESTGSPAQDGVALVDKSIENSNLAEDEQIEVLPGDIDTNATENTVPSDRTYGYVYPGKGIIILNPDALGDEAVDASTGNQNLEKQIVPELRDPSTVLNEPTPREVVTNQDGNYVWEGGFGGSQSDAEDVYPDWSYFRNHKRIFDAIEGGESFRLQARQDVVSVTYTAVVDQTEANFSLNPTYSDSNGNITFAEGIGTFPTTIGLYDDDYQLLGVAKLSPPKLKNSDDGLAVDIEFTF
jgi:hypothetical protein